MKQLKFFLIPFAIIFSIPLVVWGFLFNDYCVNRNIARNGTDAIAVVDSYHSNVEINGEPYYYLEFHFEDADGNVHTGKTSSDYTYFQVQNITTIEIRYDKNFKAIQKDFDFSNKIELIILPIFGLVGVGIWVSIIWLFIASVSDKKIREFGKEKEALYVSYGSHVSVNNVPYYFIQYQYKTEFGELKQAKTQSKFTYSEVEYFESVKKFKIKEYKQKTAITEVIDISKVACNQDTENNREFKKCLYCESVFSVEEKKCPSCGSNKFDIVHK